jgi:hypothetical protein
MSGNTIPSSSIALHGSGPLPFLLALRRPGRCIPSLSSMISHGLAGSFQPFQAFNDFQKHGDPSHGSHDEASQPISGGKEAEHSPSAGPQRTHVSRQARCPPLELNVLGREAVQNKNSVQNRALNPHECLHFCHIVHPMKECCSSSRRLRLLLQKKHVRRSLIGRKDRVISVIGA